MRSLLLIPLALALTAACGLGLCATAGWQPQSNEMLLATCAVLVGTLAGAIPVLLARRASQLTVSQMALLGTMIQLFVAIGLAAVIILGHFAGNAFMYWLLAFYWVGLAVLAGLSVRAVKAAPVTPAATTL